MGLGDYFNRKKEEYKKDEFRRKAIAKQAESARWMGIQKGTIERAKAEGYKEGRTRGTGGGFFSHFQVDPTGGMGGGGKGKRSSSNPFSLGAFEIDPTGGYGSSRRSHQKTHRRRRH